MSRSPPNGGTPSVQASIGSDLRSGCTSVAPRGPQLPGVPRRAPWLLFLVVPLVGSCDWWMSNLGNDADGGIAPLATYLCPDRRSTCTTVQVCVLNAVGGDWTCQAGCPVLMQETAVGSCYGCMTDPYNICPGREPATPSCWFYGTTGSGQNETDCGVCHRDTGVTCSPDAICQVAAGKTVPTCNLATSPGPSVPMPPSGGSTVPMPTSGGSTVPTPGP